MTAEGAVGTLAICDKPFCNPKWRSDTIDAKQQSFATRNDRPAHLRETMVPLPNPQLADPFDLDSQVKQAHGNAKGMQFMQLHLLHSRLLIKVMLACCSRTGKTIMNPTVASRLATCFCILALVLLAPACSSQSSPVSTEYTFADVVITLERTACHGTCPVYRLTIAGDGTVIYEGRSFVDVIGGRTTTLSPAQIQELVSAFEQIDFFSLPDYTDDSVADAASAITSITIDGETKIVNHYYGDDDAPQALFDLESTIDRIVNSRQWTGK